MKNIGPTKTITYIVIFEKLQIFNWYVNNENSQSKVGDSVWS